MKTTSLSRLSLTVLAGVLIIRAHLGRPDVQASVDLHRVRADDFAVDGASQIQRGGSLANGRRASQYYDLRLGGCLLIRCCFCC